MHDTEHSLRLQEYLVVPRSVCTGKTLEGLAGASNPPSILSLVHVRLLPASLK